VDAVDDLERRGFAVDQREHHPVRHTHAVTPLLLVGNGLEAEDVDVEAARALGIAHVEGQVGDPHTTILRAGACASQPDAPGGRAGGRRRGRTPRAFAGEHHAFGGSVRPQHPTGYHPHDD
jgi:hypothetical protein